MKSANQILAENLTRVMGDRKENYSTLGKRAGLAANTIKNYCDSSREGSAKVSDVEKIAVALKVSVVALLSEQAEGFEPLQAQMTVRGAFEVLAATLSGMNPLGRELTAGLLTSLAKTPDTHAAMADTLEALAKIHVSVPPADPPTPTKAKDKEAAPAQARQAGKANLTVKIGGGQKMQYDLPLRPDLPLRTVKDPFNPNHAPPAERQWYDRVRAAPKAASEKKLTGKARR